MSELRLLRDGTIVGPEGTEIDFRTPDYSVWLTIKADSDAEAERAAAAIEAAFALSTEDATRPTPSTERPLMPSVPAGEGFFAAEAADGWPVDATRPTGDKR